MSPLTKRRIQNFRANRRGMVSTYIFLFLFFISLFADFIANDKPIFVKYENKVIFPILENKIKKNFQGYKILYKLNKFNKKKLNNNTLSSLTEDINKLLPLKNLQPVSMTNYRRVYLISADKKIRATLDFDLKYKKMINYVEKFFISTNNLILEFKYSSNLDSYLRNLTPGITRLSKNSKYINSLLTSNFY